MKNRIFTIIIIVFSLLTSSSCAKMLDEVAPKGQISSDKLTENDIALLTNGTLHQYEAFISNVWCEGDYLGEEYKAGPGFNFADPHADIQSPSAAIALSRWQYCFQKLNNANLLIKTAAMAKNQDDPDVKTGLGTGYLFRALIYLNLVTRYGGVPIIKEPSQITVVPRSSEADVWKMIFEDIDAAEDKLSSFESLAYPSKEACKVLRAKACLWTRDYANAASNAAAVIDSRSFSLSKTSEEFASMFIYGTSSKETIFAPINIRSTDYIRLFENFNDTDGSFRYSPSDRNYSNLFSDSSYAAGDFRKDPTFSAADATRIIKFPNGQDGQFIADAEPSQSPIMCFRLADAYLIKAEAEWAGQNYDDAAATLREFMSSRYASAGIPAGISAGELEKIIIDENRREFYAEGHRWFDVKRFGQNYHSSDFSTWINTQYSEWAGRDFLLYWPIPQVERDKAEGKYTQNPGYAGYEN